jgi:RNA-directed DNA polymerase
MRALMRAPTDRYDRYDYLAYEYPQAVFIMTKLAQLRGVQNLPQLARVLDVKPASLSYILYWTPPGRKYATFTIPKKGGGRRNITAPMSRLKMTQTKLADLLLDIQAEMETTRSRSQCRLSHGFKEDFSIVTNATAHRNKRYVFNTDLKDFFPSINFGRVLGFFAKDRNLELPLNVATVIAQIACHNNELPQGSPCSPVISNLITHVLDIHLNRIARAGRCTYTRYVDDLTFSTNEKEFPASLARLKTGSKDAWEAGDDLIRYVYRSGFKLNHDKTRMQQRDSRQDTTGLIVNKKVNVRNEYYKIARAKCDHLFENGFCYSTYSGKDEVVSDVSLEGEMSFICHIRGLKTTDWWKEQKSFAELYRKFLDYRAFYGIRRPRIICEAIIAKRDPAILPATLAQCDCRIHRTDRSTILRNRYRRLARIRQQPAATSLWLRAPHACLGRIQAKNIRSRPQFELTACLAQWIRCPLQPWPRRLAARGHRQIPDFS